MILFSLVFSVSCSVIGCWWLGWGHVPTERRLPIGFLSAHVTAATVHVLSRVSSITLALSSSLTLSYSQSWLSLTSRFCLLFFLSPVLLFFKHLCFVPLLHVFFHCFPALICLTCHSFLCSTIWLHLPPDLPPRLFLPLTNIFPISPDFEPQAMLFVSFPIIIRLRQYDSSVYLCCHLISDVARCSLKQTTHFSFVSKRLFISFNDSQLFFLSKNKPRQDMFFLVPLQMLSIQRVGVWMIGFGQT